MRLTLTRDLPIDAVKELAPYYEQVKIVEKNRPLTKDELLEACQNTEVLICTLNDRVDESLLKGSPDLRHVISYSVGVDHLDTRALKERGMRISYTPGVLTEATADLAWTLMLGCARRIKPAAQFLNEGKFVGVGPKNFLGIELKGATLGIVGMGRIGQAVAQRALGFGMQVVYTARTEKKGVPGKSRDLENLLEVSDVVSLHCPLTAETRHLINEGALKKMKERAILVNTARGPVIDENALFKHLQNKTEFYAGLDVFEREPAVEKALLLLPNALCLPHIGSATHSAREKMASICVSEAIRFAKNEPLQYEYFYDR